MSNTVKIRHLLSLSRILANYNAKPVTKDTQHKRNRLYLALEKVRITL